MRRLPIAAIGLLLTAGPARAQDPVDRTRDRGEGVPLSMFGTYLRAGETVVYPFFEYYRDGNYEYEAGELGFTGTTELRGRYRAQEGLVLVAYGLTDDVAVEFEAAGIAASLDKSPLDSSLMPQRLEQSGIGDVEAQLRWRWKRETDARPEFFSYFETEVELITEAQVFLAPRVVLKLNNAFGLSPKATDWAPEIGLMFSFGTR